MARTIALQKISLVALVVVATSDAATAQSRPTRFWNLTRHTISELYLAPAGSTDFGPNQCKNDKDGTVDPDERLRITGVGPGHYDAKVSYRNSRQCVVRDIEIRADAVFSIADKDLKDCTK